LEGRSNNKDEITKIRDFPQEATEKLRNSEIIYRKDKENKEIFFSSNHMLSPHFSP